MKFHHQLGCLLFLLLSSLSLAAQGNDVCYDCAQYQEAVSLLRRSKRTRDPLSKAAIAARTTILKYHRRRLDPDSIWAAAIQLREVAPIGSRASAFALFSEAESNLKLFREEDYLNTRRLLQRTEFSQELQPLVEYYLLTLDAFHDRLISLNVERMTILLIAAIEQGEKYHPEMMGELIVTLCEGFGYLEIYPKIISRMKAYQATVGMRTKDELDKIIYEHGLARIYHALRRFKRAGKAQEELVNRLKSFQEPLPALTANCAFYAGEACYRINRDESCLPLYEQALKIKKRKEYIEMYVAILYHTRQYDRVIEECQSFLAEAIPGFSPNSFLDLPSINGKVMGGEYPGNLLMWKGRAQYKKSLSEPDNKAIELLSNGIQSAELGRILHNRIVFEAEGYKLTQMVLNNQNTYGLGYQMRSAYQLWLRTGEHTYRKMFFRFMEMRKNFLLSDAFKNLHLPEEQRRELAHLSRELEAYEFRFIQASQDSVPILLQGSINAVNNLDRCVRENNKRTPRKITDHNHLNYADPDELQRQLDDSTALVIYTEHWRHYYVYLITSTEQRIEKIYYGSEMPELINELTKSVSSPLQQQRSKRDKFIDRSNSVFETYLSQIYNDLIGKKRLIIIPEEHSGMIPFEVLLKSDEKKPYSELNFLIKNFEISYYNSATFYEKLKSQESLKNGAFLGFAPVFDQGGEIAQSVRSSGIFMNRFYQGIRGKSFTPLPGTEREIKTIASLLPDSSRKTVLVKGNATRNRLIQELNNQYQYVHIATHGLMSLFDPRRSAFACYTHQGIKGDFLYAHSIESLDLQTDLAVLSSCESGVGIILEGESIIALSRSFFSAGAKNILYSLWKVDDLTSSDLMIYFYQEHLKGKRYATALREAKLKLLEDPATSAPRLWAPFLLMGE